MSATSLDGEQIDFARFSGQVLVLNFWATWCAPCVAEMPSLTRLADLTSEAGVAIACVTREPEPEVREFLKTHPLDVPVYLLEGDPPEQFESAASPATFIIDKNGRVALQHRGAAAWDDPSVVSFVSGLAAMPR
ncbi:MAG: TlpA family protein disulfide reductase [Gemmatimonadetes bacterium]|nr:TlpA family protein disulfide reductase [Gemmatimonadota bacterium]